MNRFEVPPHIISKVSLVRARRLIYRLNSQRIFESRGDPSGGTLTAALFESLKLGLSLLSGLHPFFASNKFKDMGYQLQRTAKGEFYQWHVDAGPGPLSQRQLVAIWYLNSLPARRGSKLNFFIRMWVSGPRPAPFCYFPRFGHISIRGRKFKVMTNILPPPGFVLPDLVLAGISKKGRLKGAFFYEPGHLK